MERRDVTIGLGGLLAGFGIVSGLFYYGGGKQAFKPVSNAGDRLAEQTGLKSPGATDAGLGRESGMVWGEPGATAGQPVVSPTPKPTSSPKTAPAGNQGFIGERGGTILQVKLNNLTLHKCPGFDCETITSLPIGSRVLLLGERDNSQGEEWCRVRVGTREGWVSRYFLE